MFKKFAILYFSIFLIALSLVTPKISFAVPQGAYCAGPGVPAGTTCDAGLACVITGANSQCYPESLSKTALDIYNNNFMLASLNNTSDGIGGSSGGLRAVMNLTTAMYIYPPADTRTYMAYMRKNMGFPVKEAYAQASGGYGFVAFSPILPLWEVMRNIALVGYALLFVIIGFLVMLRQKIDARTVVTVQQAIPKIIISMILVIFSYAIFALIIDVVTVGTRLAASLLQSQNFIARPVVEVPATATTPSARTEDLNELLNANLFRLWDQLYNVDGLLAGFNYIPELENSLGIVKNLFLGSGAVSFGGSLLRTVIYIAMFVALLRTFMLLLTSYIMITFRIIFAPFSFFLMAIPGVSKGGFISWLQGTLAHALVFPTIFFMMVLAAMFANTGSSSIFNYQRETYSTPTGDKNNVWQIGVDVFKPNTAYWTAPGLGDFSGAIGGVLALGIILTIPKAGEMVRDAVGYKGNKSEGAAGESLKSAASKVPFVGSLTKF